MEKSKFTRLIALFLAVLFCFGVTGLTASADSGSGETEEKKYKDTTTQTTAEELEKFLNASSYALYKQRYEGFDPGSGSAKVDLSTAVFSGVASSEAPLTYESYLVKNHPACQEWTGWEEMTEEQAAGSLYLPSTGSVKFTLNVPSNGLYFIAFNYFTIEGTVNSIERKLFIDNEIPFSEASYLRFSKLWQYQYIDNPKTDKVENNFEQDLNGNDIQPALKQVQDWRTYVCSDSTGYTNGYFAFYLTEGSHTLTLEAAREAMIIGGIELIPSNDPTYNAPSYSKYVQDWKDKGAAEVKKGASKTKIEAEKPILVSDSSVYMGNDRTSAITSPNKASSQLFNVIGATSFDTVGQWAAYRFSVAESGFYNLTMRFQQSALQGMFVCRTIRLHSDNRDPNLGAVYGLEDGTPLVPFEEAYYTRYNYSDDWQSKPLTTDTDLNGDNKKDNLLFYFTAGQTYTLYIEVGLGSLADLIREVETSLSIINDSYLSIIKLTGATPDEYRDYHFADIMPEVIYNFNFEADRLARIAADFVKLCGTTGSHIATLTTVSNLLAKMGTDEMNIAKNLTSLKGYLGTLGTWINDSKASVMKIDLVSVQSPRAKAPRAKANFFQALGFEIKSFFSSFFTDYDHMGVTDKKALSADALQVWLALGRDQAKIWRSLIDSGYASQEGASPVSLKLVTGPTLLPSILAGKGPDVYLGLDSATVINYAIRGAVQDISDFSDFKTHAYGADQVLDYNTNPNSDDIYHPAALDTVTLLEKTYGLPLTMNFTMMFYRLDVLAELGIDVPETWDDVLALLPIFQSNYLEVGLTYILALDFFLYQNGGNMWKYTDNPTYAGSEVALDTKEAREAFRFCCSFYTEYGFPVAFDPANRFRTGEMPLVIADYISVYNTLTVFATEIKGLWEFGSIPGMVREDGTFNYDSIASVTSTVMLAGCSGKQRTAAWDFMKWQTSADVEAEYGNRMVALIGPSAKYAAANLDAIEQLSWTTSENAAIQDQLHNLASIVNYPGSYIYPRYIEFAFMDVKNESADPIDALDKYISTINAELTRKRQEFGLETGAPPAN